MATTSTIVRSSVFLRVLTSCAVFVALSLIIVWGYGLFRIGQIETRERDIIADWIQQGTAIYLEDGLDPLVEAVEWEEDQPVWFDDDIFWILEEEETLFALRDEEGDIIAGFPGLWADDEFTETQLDHPEIDNPIVAIAVWAEDGNSLTVGRFIPDRLYRIQGFIVTASLALISIVFPLALITGFFLSRGVFRRLETLWETAETVSKGRLEARAPLTGTGDEFDRLGTGINQMLDKVEALTRNVEAVSVGVAHDLKTPLANIGGRLELIRRDIDNPDAVNEHIDVAETRLQSLLRVFDALLRMGEIESGRRRAAFTTVDVSAMCRDLVESFQPLFEEADKTLTADIADGLSTEGDRELLTQMAANLLENALEHSRDGAQVHLTLTGDTENLHLEIGDDGPGIAPGAAERIFERFFRADASRTTPGNGLGLALVKAIADLHEADIALLDDRQGAVFAVNLPLRA
ncbi:MAG: HAMP domain-containing sensor histidine kinase [Pseudomonadota bacterium]